MSEDTKPSTTSEAKPENQSVSLKIAGSGFPELVVKVKRTTKLIKMMQAYAQRAGKNLNEIRFLFDGQKVLGDQTCEDLDIDEDESEEVIIEVVSESIGGM